jgi:hypothetical protein
MKKESINSPMPRRRPTPATTRHESGTARLYSRQSMRVDARGLVEEHPVLLGADARRPWVGLTRGIGVVDDVAVVVARGEVHRRRPRHVVPREAKRRVMEVDRTAVARPVDVEADAGGDRWRALHDAERIEEIVEVGDFQRLHAQARLARCRIDLDRTRFDWNRPE